MEGQINTDEPAFGDPSCQFDVNLINQQNNPIPVRLGLMIEHLHHDLVRDADKLSAHCLHCESSRTRSPVMIQSVNPKNAVQFSGKGEVTDK